MSADLRDKFHGCIAASFVGSAMAAPVEGTTWQEHEATFGRVTDLLPSVHSTTGWRRPAGTTEEGVERQKRFLATIFRHGRRVTGDEIVAQWLEDFDPRVAEHVNEPFEIRALGMAAAGVPARDLGGYSDLTAHVAFASAAQPIGLINAGDPDSALVDVLEIGRMYQAANSKGILWAVVTGVGVAEATRPGADVTSVIDRVLQLGDPQWVGKELHRHLDATRDIDNAAELRDYFDIIYGGIGIKYPTSHANEVVTKALCLFRLTEGEVAATITEAVNFGRDASSLAAIAAGLSGALAGAGGIEENWIATVDAATAANEFTVSREPVGQLADRLYETFHAGIVAKKDFVERMVNA
ncbi:MAG: ADP-ribosylation/Crystallin [Microbacterium sp.]|jgi:ADP-ribosylglycohydrolase|nr:ADP-ribosylation/Crystallin [Microbacterium sp.]